MKKNYQNPKINLLSLTEKQFKDIKIIIENSENNFLDIEGIIPSLTTEILENKSELIRRFNKSSGTNTELVYNYILNTNNIQFIIGSKLESYIVRFKDIILDILSSSFDLEGIRISYNDILIIIINKFKDKYIHEGIFNQNIFSIYNFDFEFLRIEDIKENMINHIKNYQNRWYV